MIVWQGCTGVYVEAKIATNQQFFLSLWRSTTSPLLSSIVWEFREIYKSHISKQNEKVLINYEFVLNENEKE
jgi:hypothetical protein